MKRNTTHRAGFTIVELLVVIIIIAILVAILLPSLGAVRNRAKVAQVTVEIKALESAIATFSTEYGEPPPSGITIHEDTDSWFMDNRSKSLIRRMWPQFDFGSPSWSPTPRLLTWDFNANGTTESTTLTGSECLVFFLGGPRMMVDGLATGFSKNPRNPFEVDSSGTRVGPFHEFDPSRVVDVDNDGAHEYQDTLETGTPYLYASGYGGKGYNQNHDTDVLLPHASFSDSPPDTRPSIGIDSNGDGVVDTGQVYYQDRSLQVPWKRDTYQIISPGFDGEYGNGGYYRRDMDVGDLGEADRDNITNFSGELSR